MSLLDQVQRDLVAAMKAKDEARLSTVRMIKAALQKHQIDAMKPLDEASEQQVLRSLVKQRSDAAEMFHKGGRPELAAKEEGERRMIETYLPAPASPEDIEGAITAAIAETGATSAKQMGPVIKTAQTKLQGKTVDGKNLSERVKARLA